MSSRIGSSALANSDDPTNEQRDGEPRGEDRDRIGDTARVVPREERQQREQPAGHQRDVRLDGLEHRRFVIAAVTVLPIRAAPLIMRPPLPPRR